MGKEFNENQKVFVFTNRCKPVEATFNYRRWDDTAQISVEFHNIMHIYDISEVFATELEAIQWLKAKAQRNEDEYNART